jgi:hypothetical protein
MAANNQTLYIYRGEEGEAVPRNATHVTVHESVRVILERAFYGHPNIVEVDCRNAEIIEAEAFRGCSSLRRVQMRGVTIVERWAFCNCKALTDVECGKLERIGSAAFISCESLRNINLPSVTIVEAAAFYRCEALTDVTFGDKLETIGGRAFDRCTSLERITLPLKYDMIEDDDRYRDVFQGCMNLRHVDLLGGGVHEFVAALPLDEWKNDMNATINSINQILPNTPAGEYNYDDYYRTVQVAGEKGRAIQTWIRSVLRKLDDYKQQHRNLLTAATTILVKEVGLPQELVINNILPCLQLPSYYAIIL